MSTACLIPSRDIEGTCGDFYFHFLNVAHHLYAMVLMSVRQILPLIYDTEKKQTIAITLSESHT